MNKHTALGIIIGLMALALIGQTVNVNFQNQTQPSQIYLPPREGSDRGPVTIHAQWVMVTAAKYESENGEYVHYTEVSYYDPASTRTVAVETSRRWRDIAQDMVKAGELAPAPNGSFEPWQAPTPN